MLPRFKVVERIEHNVESLEEVHVEFAIEDVSVTGVDIHGRVELTGRLLGNDGLGLLDVLLPEEELAVQVAQIDSVQVYQDNAWRTRHECCD